MIDYEILDGLSTLRLNRPPLNILDLPLLLALRERFAETAADGRCSAVVLIGSPEFFSAGADIHLFEQIRSKEDARDLLRRFQEVFQGIEDSPKPVVAALAGHVMGGALELAMACHGRVATPDARFSMPEIRLGILPGAGGTQRLTRLVGPARSIEMMLTAESLSADDALRCGLIDAVCPRDTLVAAAQRLAASAAPLRRTCDRTERAHADALPAALRQGEHMADRFPPELVAPRHVLQVVATGIRDSFEAGIAAEREACAECMASPGAQNRIYAYFATRQAAKFSSPAAPEIRRTAVVGMGSMGTGIAQSLAAAGLPVTVVDSDADAVARALTRIRQSLDRRVGEGKLAAADAEATLARIAPAGGFAALAEADLIIEAVFEMLEVKREVIGRIEAACRNEAIVATNTSTLSLDALAASMRLPERLVGMHFFNPAHSMPLVEIVRRRGVSDGAVAAAVQLARRLRKTPVLVNNREGFLVNRVFVPYLVEAFTLLEEGAPAREIDAAMVRFGFPMGPLALCDMTGIDIVVHAHRELVQAFAYHGPLAEVAHRLVALGRTGQKTGAGVYRYEPGSRTALDDDALGELVAQVQRKAGLDPPQCAKSAPISNHFPREWIASRLVGRMLAEAFRVLEENVARSESDLDAALVLGTGFPDYRGGIVRYARDRGLDTVLAELENLSASCSERYAPSRYLRNLARP